MGPRIELSEYLARRERLFKQLDDNSVVVLLGAQECARSNDTNYRFRQDSNFFYLTGFNEPDAALVLIKENKNESILFTRARDPKAEQWEGKRLGIEKAPKGLMVDAAFDIKTFQGELANFIKNRKAVYYSFSQSEHFGPELFKAIHSLYGKERHNLYPPSTLKNIDEPLSEMRLIKSEAELECLRYVAKASCLAHQKAMELVKQSDFEYQLEGTLQAELSQAGCQSMAYDPIVASGENACILHYTENNAPLDKEGLVLIDAGGEYLNYAADITRTFPANGVFSKAQKDIYQLVLRAQITGIEAIAPGVSEKKVQAVMLEVLVEGLCELGLLKGDEETLIKEKAYLPFYMHGSGHWLGLDVHDVGSYKKNGEVRAFEPGMVLTVEPGIYILPSLDVPDEYKGIGVRIEDDVVVTETGHEVLTREVSKDLTEIEALVNGK